jgi:LuxR family transcriptional regulator, maltose regulon positive regulatory protein
MAEGTFSGLTVGRMSPLTRGRGMEYDGSVSTAGQIEMGTLTIPEKLRIPPLPAAYLARPRLDRLWEQRREKRLLLVTGGAGYGKSSYLAAQARSESLALWYRLDEGDSHFGSFVSHLVQLLSASGSDPNLDQAACDPALARRLLATVVAAWRARGPSTLVFDDVHLLQEKTEVLGFLGDLIRYRPEESTLVLSSREPVTVGTTRALVEGRAFAIDAHDLEFRSDEVAALFHLRFGFDPGAGRCRRILAATEGWAAGLEILFQALDPPSPAAVDAVLQRFQEAGSGWFDYFAEEVVGHLDENTADFLRRSSILSRLDPPVCDRVLGRRDSLEILERLVRRNLFTLREGGPGGAYRYHLLFRSYLRAALGRVVPGDVLRRLRGSAARALLRSGDAAEALELFSEAEEPESALRLINRQGEALLNAGRYEAVEKALQIIPPSRLRQSANALFVQGRLLDYLGRWKEAEAVYRRILTRPTSPARRIEVCSILGQIASRRGEHARALALSRAGLDERGRPSPLTRGRLLMTLGISACELGRLEEGEAHLEKARSHFERHGDSAGQAYVDYITAANVHVPRGQFVQGQEAARRALASFRALGNPRRICVCGAVLSWVTALAGEVSEAREGATEVRRLAETLGLRQQEALALYVLGYCSVLDGDLSGAQSSLQESYRLGDLLGESDARILPRLLLAECLLAAGLPQAARSLAEEGLEIARRLRDPLQQAQSRVVLARAALTDGGPEARALWRSAESSFRRLGAAFDLHRLLLLRLSEEELRPAERSRLLAELLAGAERFGHDSIFLLLEPARAVRVLPAALCGETGYEYAAGLLTRLGEPAVREISVLTRESDDVVRSRAVALLAQIGGDRARNLLSAMARRETDRPSSRQAQEELARAPVQPLHIMTLGRFRVRIGEVPVPEERWRSARARRLFQFLLVQRFQWISGDQIIEALWPEAELDRARSNLWQSVHYLRRVLEPELKDRRGSRYIRSSEDRYRIEPGQGHFFDLVTFEESIRQADRLVASRKERVAEPLYRKALELYEGEFLAESPYEEFAAAPRERLRDLVLHAATRLAGLCASSRRWDLSLPVCRQGLAEDPYHEELHYLLIQAQIALGQRREAAETYRALEERMAGELCLVPSRRLRALIEAVRPAAPTRR